MCPRDRRHSRPFEIGVFTFKEITADPAIARPIDPAVRVREFIDLARLTDQPGLDVFGVGELHRPDFAVSSPPLVLRGRRSGHRAHRLTRTVTMLSAADPVKAFEGFATVDLISQGRAENTAGRGASTESFSLFGCDLALSTASPSRSYPTRWSSSATTGRSPSISEPSRFRSSRIQTATVSGRETQTSHVKDATANDKASDENKCMGKKIGFVGLGTTGFPMAVNLKEAASMSLATTPSRALTRKPAWPASRWRRP